MVQLRQLSSKIRAYLNLHNQSDNLWRVSTAGNSNYSTKICQFRISELTKKDDNKLNKYRNFGINTNMTELIKEHYLRMALDEKRKLYRCKNGFTDLSGIITWPEYFEMSNLDKDNPAATVTAVSNNDSAISSKVSLWQGDITTLEIDAIVNAANSRMLGGGGVDGAIHRAAGTELVEECRTHNGCPEGEAKITGGYKLPAKYVIHTVGPMSEKPDALRSCYQRSLQLLLDNNLRSIAFPCIATGIYGYPREGAATIALKTVGDFLDKNPDKIDRVIFTVFLPEDVKVYEKLLPEFFPLN